MLIGSSPPVGKISIHAPREGSDVFMSRQTSQGMRFLSTLPARGATSFFPWSKLPRIFLSTLPARGATYLRNDNGYTYGFLSTLPARGATRSGRLAARAPGISIHAPREGSDR